MSIFKNFENITLSTKETETNAEWEKRAETVDGWGIESGHFMPEEAPNQVCKTIARFLT